MQGSKIESEIPQYSLVKILLVWAAASVPMGVLGWVVAPALSVGANNPGLVRLAVLTVGLIWQFVLVCVMLYRETGSLSWSVIRGRLWLQQPTSAESGKSNPRLWWWLIPTVILTALFEMVISGGVDQLWTSVFPALSEPPSFSMAGFLESPEGRASLVGGWGFFLLFIISAVFNTILGEELLFRGLLLPRMQAVFGKWDWLANGFLFGFYHLHQPWMMVSGAIEAALLFALPTRRFRCTWFGIIAHSGQSVFFAFLLLGLVLGLA